jgi:chromosome partitioning protein
VRDLGAPHISALGQSRQSRGLTALDELCVPGIDGEAARLYARCEIHGLLEALKLPSNERGRRRAALRAEWFASRDSPLDTDILAGP